MTNAIPIDDTTMLSRPGNLVASEIDGEAVILSIDSGQFFQLNQVGSRIWDALAVPTAMGDLCRAMQDRFDVDQDTCRRDIADFVALLAQHGLVASDTTAD
jgi:hypothetical protein